jgi:uncharacterized protein with GYD domain
MPTHRIVVRSIGTATAAVPKALAEALPFAPERLARCLYQAPAVLLDGLAEDQARSIGDLLAGTGLEVEVAGPGERVEEGGPELELAVHVGDPARFRDVAAELARFLGCAVPRAVSLLCARPPVVLGRVSRATAEALRARLEPLGAEVDASHTATAVYDVYVNPDAGELRHRLARLLKDAGAEVVREGPLVAYGVPRATAETLWSRIGADARWQLLDRAFQRMDVVMEQAAAGPEAAEAIVEVTGMPPALVSRVCASAPVVLCDAVPAARAAAALSRLADAGVAAAARLVTLESWDVVVHSADDPRRAAEVISTVLETEAGPVALALRRLPARVGTPVGLTRGRWLLHELAAVGTRAVLEDR